MPPHTDSPNSPITWPCRSSGARSTIQAEPAVNRSPSPAPMTRRETSATGSDAGASSRAPAAAVSSVPATIAGRRPRRSAMCPASGRTTIALIEKAPITTPTATSPACTGPRTNGGSTGRAAPAATNADSVAQNTPAAVNSHGARRDASRPV